MSKKTCSKNTSQGFRGVFFFNKKPPPLNPWDVCFGHHFFDENDGFLNNGGPEKVWKNR